jgi:hypothetical protein
MGVNRLHVTGRTSRHKRTDGTSMHLMTVEAEQLEWIKGVAYPADVRYREIIVTGPPCSGKTTLVQRLGGWPEEGYIDLASNHWWHSRVLAFRPREIHFGIPFRGFRNSHTVFDGEWLAARSAIDYGRIQIPPGKGWFLQSDWRKLFVFDFQLPPVDRIYSVRKSRAIDGSHPVDGMLSVVDVEMQLAVYGLLALHFHRCGMRVIVREEFLGMPRMIVDTDQEQGSDG